jgi:hypothetical protein
MAFSAVALFGSTILAGLVRGSAGATQPTPDQTRAVLAVVETMFRGMRAKDTALVRSVFEPGARLVGIRTGKDGKVLVQTISVDQWVQFVGRDPRPDWTERAFEPEVRIEGTLATVWAHYDFHFGEKFSHCGVDAVQLLELPVGWRIVSIADTYQPEGCPRREPPGR